jgi:hypothetical protein
VWVLTTMASVVVGVKGARTAATEEEESISNNFILCNMLVIFSVAGTLGGFRMLPKVSFDKFVLLLLLLLMLLVLV